MARIKNMFFVLLTVAFLSGLVAGCGGVSEEQLKQLSDLKAEVESLQSQVSAKEGEKSSLQKQIADKDAKIKDFQKQMDAAKANCK